MFKRTENYMQDASRFHNVGVGKTSMHLSNMNEETYHKSYGSSLYSSPKLPRDIGAVNSPYNETSIAKDINNVKNRRGY